MTRIEALTRRPGLTLAAADRGPVATLAWSALARLLRWDEAVLLKARRLHGPQRTVLARALTRAGDGSSWTVYGLLLLATFDPAGASAALRLATAAGIATLFGIAVSRVYLGAHYPLDVAAGAGIGAVAGLAARAILGG
ncbi:MAG TPA: phosphatase PAP2 family protein [Anaeromyxobacteraceae bacterium]|nr:phosphatase PAP2 family protein [Anaeromyxobacteraceae bacterium]